MEGDFKTVRRLHLGLIIAMLVLSGWAWVQLPADATIPIHWNAAGEVDDTAGKAFGLLLIPGVSLAILALLALIPRIEPRRTHLLDSSRAYAVVWAAVAGLMVLVHGIVVAASFGLDPSIERTMPVAIGLVFVIIAAVMPDVRSNFMFGLRTPWTLTSERSWEATHRAARWVFGAIGLVLAALGLAGAGQAAFIILIVGALGGSVGLMVYSYYVWRADPERTQA